MHFKILCREGDAEYDYALDIAELKFDELRTAGMVPMVIEQEGKNRLLDKFDPDVEDMIWMPVIMGG